MDALSSLGINWRSLISQIVNFIILLILLRLFLYKPIMELLEKRRVKIEQGLKDAEDAKTKLALAQDESQKIIQDANKKAQNIISLAQKQAEKQITQAREESKKESIKIIESAKKQAEVEKIKIMGKAKSELGDIVIMAIQRITQNKPSYDEIEKTLKQINV